MVDGSGPRRFLTSTVEGSELIGLLVASLDQQKAGIAIYLPLDDGDDYLHVYASPAYQALKPFRPMEGHRYTEIWPEFAEYAIPRLKEVLDTGRSWVEHDQPLTIEVTPGTRQIRYFTYEIQRIQIGTATYLMNSSTEVTSEVQTRQRLEQTLAILDAAPVPMSYLDRDLVYVQCNQSAAAALGRPREEILGRRLEEIAGRDSDVYRAVSGVVESGEPFSRLLEFEPPGQPDLHGHFIVSYVPDKDEEGRVHGVFAEGFDVSEIMAERIRYEEELLEEHRRLRTLLDALPVAVFITDGVGRTVYTNQHAKGIWGEIVHVDSSDEYGVYKGWSSETGERLNAEEWAGARALTGEVVLGEVVNIERFTGERATIVDSAAPIRDASGGITGAVIVEQDISELVRAEEQLQEAHEALKRSEEKWSLAIEHFAEGAIIATEDEQVIYWNPAAREMHGFTTSEEGIEPLEQTPITFDLLTPEDRRVLPLGEWPMRRIKRGEPVRNLELVLRRPDQGWERIVSYSGSMVETAGNGRLIFLSVHDLTEQRRVEAQLREAARYGRALNEIDADVTSTLDVERIMSLVVERAAKVVGADLGVVYVPVDGRRQVRHAWQAPSWLYGHMVEDREIPLSMQAARERRVLFFPEPETHPLWEGSMEQRLGARQVLDAPLMLGPDEVGDLGLYKLDGESFTEEDRDFLQKVATSATLALQNATRYERERGVADTLQDALLKVPEAIPGVEFAHAYHSAAEAARVGGDFYDIFPISAECIGLVVGDVAGKGLEASVLTSLAKYTIRAHAMEKGPHPAEILRMTNEALFRETGGDSFVTIFCGVLDLGGGRLVYANGGHTTTVVVAADGSLTELPYTGPVLGAFPDIRFDQSETYLDYSAPVLLYTDGLTEARRGDELFGEERLFELLGSIKDGDTEKIVRAVVDEVLRFTGGRLNDDLALLSVRRLENVEENPRAERVAL